MTPFGILVCVTAGLVLALVETCALLVVAVIEWRRAVKGKGGYMPKREVQRLLREIAAKKELGYTLTEREQAILALYGEEK